MPNGSRQCTINKQKRHSLCLTYQIPAKGRKSKKVRAIVALWQNYHRPLSQRICTLKPYFFFNLFLIQNMGPGSVKPWQLTVLKASALN